MGLQAVAFDLLAKVRPAEGAEDEAAVGEELLEYGGQREKVMDAKGGGCSP